MFLWAAAASTVTAVHSTKFWKGHISHSVPSDPVESSALETSGSYYTKNIVVFRLEGV